MNASEAWSVNDKHHLDLASYQTLEYRILVHRHRNEQVSTRIRLLYALTVARAPAAMLRRAEQGLYDELESPLPLPLTKLVQDAMEAKLYEIVTRTLSGEFNAREWEAERWYRG